jgi:sugar O-acyltransferase (sialic acid O-acetyltransferase NeuD family)
MIIVGAKGFAKQLVEIFYQNKKTKNLFFFDDVSKDLPGELYGIKIIKTVEEVSGVFQNMENEFCLGLGGPLRRREIAQLLENLGGSLSSVISVHAFIAAHAKSIGKGATILTSSIIENDAAIGAGVLVNSFAAIYHECIIGDFCEIAPGAKILGGADIGENCFIGANAVILPKIKIGTNSLVGAGAVVTKDVLPNTTVVGNPAKEIHR